MEDAPEAAAVAVMVCILSVDDDSAESVVVEGEEGEAGGGGEGESECDPRAGRTEVLVVGGESSSWGSRLIRSLVALARASFPLGGASCEAIAAHSESSTSP